MLNDLPHQRATEEGETLSYEHKDMHEKESLI